MSIRFESHIDWKKIRLDGGQVQRAVKAGGDVIMAEAQVLVPKRTDRLSGEGEVKTDRGGLNTVGLVFGGPYARWVHEHLHFKHPFGGQAKFLETAMTTKGEAAKNAIADKLWREIM